MMQYAIFARPVVTIYDLPQTTKQSEAGLVSTIGDEGLYGQACQVRTAPGGVTAEGVPLSPEVAEVVTFYGYHGFADTSSEQQPSCSCHPAADSFRKSARFPAVRPLPYYKWQSQHLRYFLGGADSVHR